MKNNINIFFMKLVSYICERMAFKVSASACNWSAYQPEEPKCLNK